MSLAQQHRESLCDTATASAPDAPTLCPPWTVRDLLAHLAVRDSRPDAVPGVLPGVSPAPFVRHTESLMEKAAAQDYADLVEQVRSGPPAWSPTRLKVVADLANLSEFVIHHEDIVRAAPQWQESGPAIGRVAPDIAHQTQAAVWRMLAIPARLHYRSSEVGVVLVSPGYGRSAVKRPPAERGSVVLTGDPVEQLLYASGRTEVAEVELEGDPEDIERFTAPLREDEGDDTPAEEG